MRMIRFVRTLAWTPKIGRLPAAIAVLSLALAACWGAKHEPGRASRAPGLRVCRNEVLGFAISYPDGWYTTSLLGKEERPKIACNYFDPRPFGLYPEIPPVALEAHLAADPMNKVLRRYTDPIFATTLSRERTKVGGRPAVRFEVELTGQGLLDKGTMQYGYAIDLGSDGTFIVLTTAPSASDPEYAANKAIVDRATTTFKLL